MKKATYWKPISSFRIVNVIDKANLSTCVSRQNPVMCQVALGAGLTTPGDAVMFINPSCTNSAVIVLGIDPMTGRPVPFHFKGPTDKYDPEGQHIVTLRAMLGFVESKKILDIFRKAQTAAEIMKDRRPRSRGRKGKGNSCAENASTTSSNSIPTNCTPSSQETTTGNETKHQIALSGAISLIGDFTKK